MVAEALVAVAVLDLEKAVAVAQRPGPASEHTL